jgi:hypothetical protein
MMPLISLSLKARIVTERRLPLDASCRLNAAPVSSSGTSTIDTRSYGPTVHAIASNDPPLLSSHLLGSVAAVTTNWVRRCAAPALSGRTLLSR